MLPDQLGQGGGLDELHDDEGPLVLVDDVVDGHRPRVAEARAGPRLAEDLLPKARLLPLVELRRDEDLLHRHRTAEQRVLGAPHDPETAASDHGPKSIPVADELAGHLGERHRHRSYPIWRALDGCYRRRVP